MGFQCKQTSSLVSSCIYWILSGGADLSPDLQNLCNPTLKKLERPGQLVTLAYLPGLCPGCLLYLQGYEVHGELRLHQL